MLGAKGGKTRQLLRSATTQEYGLSPNGAQADRVAAIRKALPRWHEVPAFSNRSLTARSADHPDLIGWDLVRRTLSLGRPSLPYTVPRKRIFPKCRTRANRLGHLEVAVRDRDVTGSAMQSRSQGMYSSSRQAECAIASCRCTCAMSPTCDTTGSRCAWARSAASSHSVIPASLTASGCTKSTAPAVMNYVK
jgi:hypothetical protein